jgi:hypothetical protein
VIHFICHTAVVMCSRPNYVVIVLIQSFSQQTLFKRSSLQLHLSRNNALFILLSTTNKMQHYTIFFIIVDALHVSGGFSAHHQELKNCTHSIWYSS